MEGDLLMKTFKEFRSHLKEDYEHEMARREMAIAMNAIQRITKHLNGEGDIEAWVQSKLTRATDYLDTVADYMDSESVAESVEHIEESAWTRKEGQNKNGGLNEKGRKSYERENPGSDLKAPSKKVGNPRRASFCARMKGMRKRQKDSNNTGNDRLSKSLRAWNC
jgi:ribosomal protein S15P/S13E